MEFFVPKEELDHRKKKLEEQENIIKENIKIEKLRKEEAEMKKNEYIKNEYQHALEKYNASQEEQINEDLFKCKDKLIDYYAKHNTTKGYKCIIEQRTCFQNKEAKRWMKQRFPHLQLKTCGNWFHLWNLEDPEDRSGHMGSKCIWETTDKTFSLKIDSQN